MAIFYLYQSHSDSPLRSPWTEIRWPFWAAYWLLAASGLWLIKTGHKLAQMTIIAWWLLTYSVASLIYFSAFGFDPFIHQAAEKTIITQGQVLPKTPYYIGQYAIVVSLRSWTGLAVSFLERWLLPLLAALFMSLLIIAWFRKNNLTGTTGRLVTWLWPLFSWPLFIVTTPQNLAYFFLLITVLSAVSKKPNRPLFWAAALACLACQPLAGLPALTMAALTSLQNYDNKKSQLARWLTGGLTALILPLSLWYANWQKTNSWQISWPPLVDLANWLKTIFNYHHFWPNKESWLLNLIYSWQAWQPVIAVILIIVGWHELRRWPLIWQRVVKPLNLSLAVSLMLASLISYNFVIGYERYSYLQRFWWLLIIINLPAALLAVGRLVKNWLNNKEKLLHWPIIIALASLMASGLYLTYPRIDNYSNAKGLSVGAADLAAVRWIENKAPGDYVVLANQQVGAAALGEYGFYRGQHPRYLKNQIFYYPIPTSGVLYEYYLKMVDNYPSRSTVQEACLLAGVDYGYLVLNDYWYSFEKLAQEAAAEANSTTRLADGQIVIFGYHCSGN